MCSTRLEYGDADEDRPHRRDVERFDWGVTNYTSLIMSKSMKA